MLYNLLSKLILCMRILEQPCHLSALTLLLSILSLCVYLHLACCIVPIMLTDCTLCAWTEKNRPVSSAKTALQLSLHLIIIIGLHGVGYQL